MVQFAQNPKGGLRFGVGTLEEPGSSVWVFKAQGNECYLGVRTVMGMFKLSLHAEMYQTAFTSESGVLRPDTGSRLFQKWRRPPQARDWLTLGPTVIVPYIPPELAQRSRWFNEYGKPMYRVPAPGEGQMVRFEIWLGAPSKILLFNDWNGVVGYVGLRDGSTAWVTWQMEPMAEQAADEVKAALENIPWRARGNTPEDFGGVLMKIMTSPEGLPFVLDMPATFAFEQK